jgi:NTP pyrophosphatase (non-canonical NTP hydrolase)
MPESKLNLTPTPTLNEWQTYMRDMCLERGFVNDSLHQECLLLGEEVGELFKAVRKTTGVNIDPSSKASTIADELADIFIYLCCIANMSGVNLEQAVRAKEEVNKQRTWTKQAA